MRELRITTLVAAPALAAIALLADASDRLLRTTAPALGLLWLIMILALGGRAALDAHRRGPADSDLQPAWHQLDILTATGGATLWTGAGALIGAAFTGWASLTVIGVLGLGAVFTTAAWTAITAGGDAPWRGATIERAIEPPLSTEGDALRERVRIAGVQIPSGMRLFAESRALPDGAIARYAVGARCSHGEVLLESELGGARRGEHRAPPLALWLGDVLGLTRTQPVGRGEARFAVLPRPARVDGASALLGTGGDDATAPALHQPSDGTFRIRPYVAGDDTRRIHWVRSLQQRELVVRLPDEVPHTEPALRIVLDSELSGSDALTCRAPHELLDALVRVWLGVARALADTGARVTLVAVAVRRDVPGAPAAPIIVERPLAVRAAVEGQRLGARAIWQDAIPLARLVANGAPGGQTVIVSSRPRAIAAPAVGPLAADGPRAWVVVPEDGWTAAEPPLPERSIARLPFPAGAADYRLGRREREHDRHRQRQADRSQFRALLAGSDWKPAASDRLARRRRGRVVLEVLP